MSAPAIPSASRRLAQGRRAAGFSLVELMIAIAVLALLIAVGVPSFRQVILSSRLTSYANDLLAATQVARSEAIKRNTTVQLCVSTNGTSCSTTGAWQDGWIILAGTAVLQRGAALPTGWRINQATTVRTLNFTGTGFGTTTTAWTVCRNSPLGDQERVVTVTAMGSAAVTRTSTGACP